MMYVIYVMNHIALASLRQNPIFCAFGTTSDITPLQLFTWWEPVYYYDQDLPFPDSREKIGRLAGFADVFGDAFCFKVVTVDTQEVIYRSVLRSATDEGNKNLRPSNRKPPDPDAPFFGNREISVLEDLLSESQMETLPIPNVLQRDASEIPLQLTSASDDDFNITEIPKNRRGYFDLSQLIGKSFLREKKDDGANHRAQIIERIETVDDVAYQYLVKMGAASQTTFIYRLKKYFCFKKIYG